MIEENYDEWEGKTIPYETFNETLCELEEKENKIVELEEDIKYYKNKVDILNELIKAMDTEIKRLDKKHE